MKRKLFLLLALMLGFVSGVKAQTSPRVGAIIAAGDYYIYNVGADAYLGKGSSYGTHAIVDGGGVVIDISASDDNWLLHFSGISSGSYLSKDGWVDAGSDRSDYTTFTFEPVDYAGYTNVYRLKANNGDIYLYWYGGGANDVYSAEARLAASPATAVNSYWMLIPKSQRDKSGASVHNPIDVTYLLTDPDNDVAVQTKEKPSTTWSGDFQIQTNEHEEYYTCWLEKWAGQWSTSTGTAVEVSGKSGYHLKDYKAYQTVSTLPAGKYRLTAKAAGIQQDTGESVTGVSLYAGTNTTSVTALGTYSVDFTADGSSNVEIGIKTESTTANWVSCDGFRLYYFGNDCSSSITNPGFDDNSGWTGLGSVSNSEVEYYGGNNAQKTFDLYQDLSGLSAGIYAVEAQGFYRNGAGIDERRAKAQEEQLAVLYAMGQDNVERSTSLLSMYEEAGKRSAYGSLMGDVPNSMAQAQDFISAGYYKNNRVIVEVGNDGKLRIGGKKGTAVTNDWTIFDNFSLTKLSYSTLAEAYAAEWNASKAEATAILNSSDYEIIVSGSTQRIDLSSAVSATPSDLAGYISALSSLRTAVNNFKAAKYAYNLYATKAAAATEAYNAEGTTYVNVTGDEKTTFNTAYATYVSGFSPATNNAENYYNAAVAIGSATDAFTDETIKNNYNEYAAEVATATLLGTDVSGVAAPTTASAALTAAHSINVLNYNKVVAEEYEDVSASTLGAWTDVNVTSRRGQHWDGTTDGSTGTEYFEMNSGYYNNSWTMSRSQTVNLAAGKYILKVACRASTSASATLSVTIGETTISTISGHQGDTGKGITTSGVASYDEGTFANSNNGRGFEWKFIPFELAETGNATLSFTAEGHALHQFVSFTSLALLTDQKVAARTSLLNKINEATNTRKSANEGPGIFQIPAAAGTTFGNAITTAQGVYDDEDASLEEINTATSTLNTAIETYQATELNAPDAEKRYCIVVATEGHAKEGMAVGIALGATSDNNPTGYTISTGNTTNQSVAFTQVSGNSYNINFETAEGTTYLTYGTENGSAAGWKDSQIQATTVDSNKGNFTIAATNKANVFNIYNIHTNSTIACQAGGIIYTEAGNADFTLVEATAANMAVNATAKWGTFCAPFAVIIPDGVDAYTCADATNGVLNLVEVTTTIPANTPVILNAESGLASTTFYGKKVANESEDLIEGGMLRGNVSASAKDITYTGNEYLLQRNGGKTGFYKVNNENTYKVGYNRCYLVMDSNLDAREAFFFFGDDVTAINTIEAAEAENGALKDGKYLIGNKIVLVKNGVKYSANGQKLN